MHVSSTHRSIGERRTAPKQPSSLRFNIKSSFHRKFNTTAFFVYMERTEIVIFVILRDLAVVRR